ncbi:uncharacterized protein N7473_013396 [Penicillium subrubescens]|uniref:uncharacterized protein n=1 Tax=Penicillium subrubescens TaxID=1316194 RepID=UPI002544EC38|nr:uncharacterized protein N7473_013396 [Penicillium subrubescens]KAJ5873523.1 hypothetical protein N7473_013396 [Penicillium subrubescens]
MTFLSRDKRYQTEKPYATDFPVDEIDDAKMTNHIFDTRPVIFHDARASKETFTLDQNGFCFIEAKTSLQAEDATSERTEIMEQYMQEIVGILRTNLPQYQEIKAMDFQVRKRHQTFPNGEERRAEFAQPSTMAHTDFSARGAFLRMADIFPDQTSYYQNRKFDLINLINAEKDVTTNDALHYKRVGENSLLHHDEAHRWYYLSDMRENDLIVFRNVDSEGDMPRGFHASFHNPDSTGDLRHSIEVRLVAFHD